MHRTLRAALNEAVRRSHLARNPVLLAKAPKLDEEEVEPYDVAEIQRLLEAAAKQRNGARWALALALGLRQGGALGLQWDDVNLEKGTIRIRRSRLRPRYAHGCDGTCGKTPGLCPQRESIRPPAGRVKSKAGRRTIGLPPQLVALLHTHRAEQELERATVDQLWHDEGWVFATPAGQPVNPRTDTAEWKRLLREARLREARLHDARHTAATVLLVLQQPTPTVRRDSLAVVLAAAEACIAGHADRCGSSAELQDAIADLRAALPPSAGPAERANEPKTEPRRPAES